VPIGGPSPGSVKPTESIGSGFQLQAESPPLTGCHDGRLPDSPIDLVDHPVRRYEAGPGSVSPRVIG
jgi:hypothetical protein